jgi:hypothetical protein
MKRIDAENEQDSHALRIFPYVPWTFKVRGALDH